MSIKANSKLSSPAFSRRIGKIVEEISEDGLTPQCAFSLEKKKKINGRVDTWNRGLYERRSFSSSFSRRHGVANASCTQRIQSK